MIVTYIYPLAENDQLHVQLRCKNLAGAINRTGLHKSFLLDLDSFLNQSEDAQQICTQSDILVIYKHLYGHALRMVQYWQARDKKVLVDFDEALDMIPPDFDEHAFWKSETTSPLSARRERSSPLEQFRWGLRMVDSATVPSQHLVEAWSNLTTTHQVPNYLNINHYPPLPTQARSDKKVVVGIQCQAIGAESLASSGLLSAIEEILPLRPHVYFQIFSSPRSSIGRQSAASNRISYRPCVPYHEWPSILTGLDIGVAVINDAYGMHSSPIALTEFMIMRIPWLASDLPPFRALNQYGWLIPNAREYWKRSLIEVIDHLDLYRKEASRAAFLYALGQDVSANISKVLNLYQSIL